MERFTFYEYTSLSDHDQYNLLFTVGDFVDAKIVGFNRYVLYRLYDIFVELTYNITSNTISDKVVFKNIHNKSGDADGRKQL